MNELQAAAERRKPGAFNDILETEALADWAKKVITSMPNGNLPPGPWGYMTMKNDDWGYVRTPENDIVANTSTSAEGREFYDSVCAEFGFGSPEWKAGPAKARAVAELLIWAQGVVIDPATGAEGETEPKSDLPTGNWQKLEATPATPAVIEGRGQAVTREQIGYYWSTDSSGDNLSIGFFSDGDSFYRGCSYIKIEQPTFPPRPTFQPPPKPELVTDESVDAARYRWLRDNDGSESVAIENASGEVRYVFGEELDAAIDAAMEGE